MIDRRIKERLSGCLENLYEEGFPRDCDPYLVVKEAADEFDRLLAAIAAEEEKNRLLRLQAGNAEAARKSYEDAWRQAERERDGLRNLWESAKALTMRVERERDEARAEIDHLKSDLCAERQATQAAMDEAAEWRHVFEARA